MRHLTQWPADVPVPDYKIGDRVLCRTYNGRRIEATVLRVQMSEGPGQRWPAVRVVPDSGSFPNGVNWPVEDVERLEDAL